jgi:hypothetical protein
MALNYNLHILKMIRLGKLLSLIFFASFVLPSCRESKHEAITIIWKEKNAVAISIPKSILDDFSRDSVNELLQIHLENKDAVPILGDYSTRNDEVIFQPIVPFSRGLNYELRYRRRQIGQIKIPLADSADSPVLLSIYPTHDTLPENLLKLYFQFSRPMREGESQNHIALLNDRNDTIQDVFLNLQPELWNKERTVLTIWLDPGRIKRELIPNQKMGNPLKKGERYKLTVAAKWKDVQGLPLTQTYTRQFVVGNRDSISPALERWVLDLPGAKTSQPLVINTGEPLDFFLLQETVQIIDEKGNKVDGSLVIGSKETQLTFMPKKEWQPGKYSLQVASQLEDLAGNNLNKVFDRDITVKQSTTEKAKYVKNFTLD